MGFKGVPAGPVSPSGPVSPVGPNGPFNANSVQYIEPSTEGSSPVFAKIHI